VNYHHVVGFVSVFCVELARSSPLGFTVLSEQSIGLGADRRGSERFFPYRCSKLPPVAHPAERRLAGVTPPQSPYHHDFPPTPSLSSPLPSSHQPLFLILSYNPIPLSPFILYSLLSLSPLSPLPPSLLPSSSAYLTPPPSYPLFLPLDLRPPCLTQSGPIEGSRRQLGACCQFALRPGQRSLQHGAHKTTRQGRRCHRVGAGS
jgi:hypothetical protein